jgi:lysophospholipase L1-like esterase
VSRRRKIVLGLLGLLALGELGARVWGAALGGTGSLYDFVVQGERRFKMRPGVSVTVPERYGDIRYRFNREGYRDVDHDPASPRRRIVWLGDSVSFGLGVDQDRTFVALLQRDLAARRDPWELVSLAIFAYHLGNHLDALREDGLKHRPDLVVVQLYMNDFSIPIPGEGGSGAATPVRPPSLGQRLSALKNRLVYKSALYLRLQQAALRASYTAFHDLRRSRFPETLNDAEPRHKAAFLAAHPDDGEIAAFQALAAIRRTAAAAGARTFLWISPDETQLFSSRFDAVNHRVRRFCESEGIEFYDPLPILRARPNRAELFNDGVHYSPEGHAVVARLLRQELERRGLL